MFALISRAKPLSRLSTVKATTTAARATGSLPRLAQVAELETVVHSKMPLPVISNVFPVTTAQYSPGPSQDEFWRKVPIWENVSAQDFLSYRWSVSEESLSS